MGTNLTNLPISSSFQNLLQISQSNIVTNGEGTQIGVLDVTSSLALDNVYTASAVANILTFTKGDGSTFDVEIAQSGSVESASYATNAGNAYTASYVAGSNVDGAVANATSASFATTAASVISASHAENADVAITATSAASAATATSSSYVAGSNVDGQVTSALSASLATENVYTASAAANIITFTKGDGSTFDVEIAQSGSVESASYASVAELAYTASYVAGGNVVGTVASAILADSASYVAGASVDGAVASADDAEKITYAVQNNTAGTLAKGTPIHVVGSTNGTSLVIAASASVAGTMPAHGILNTQLTAGQDGEATIIGQISGVDTSAFSAGDTVYVGAFGGYTNVKPTGSGNLVQNLGVVKKVDAVAGSGEIFGTGRSNDLPNIAEGNVWVGNSDGVPIATTTSSLNVTNAVSSSYILGSNVDGPVALAEEVVARLSFAIKNNTAGTLFKGTPVHIEASSGSVALVIASSASVANTMPAHGVLNQTISASQEGEATIIGNINGVDTSAFSTGDIIYVGPFGAYTNIKPTGSDVLIQDLGVVKQVDPTNGDGEIFGTGRFANLPNLQSEYVWVGNSDDVPTAVTESSLNVGTAQTASLALDLDPNGNYTVNQISASSATFTSASIGFLQSVTGSAKIIGDAFIILNADTPTQRYAGIKVYDSGSTPIASSSLVWDGQTDDWKYEYSASGTHESAVVMFGPESDDLGTTIYPATNAILKSVGGHHLSGSIMSDDGSTVTVAGNLTGNVITANTNFAGNLVGVADSASYVAGSNVDGQVASALSASHAITASYALNVPETASYALYADSASFAITSSYVAAANVDGQVASALSSSHALQADSALAADTATSASFAITSSYVAGSNVDGVVALATTSSYAITASFALNAGGGGFEESFTNEIAVGVTHSLNSKAIGVFVYDSNDFMIQPSSIKTTTLDTIDVTFSQTGSGRIVIVQ